MDERTVNRVLAAYGIGRSRLLGVEKGYRNQSHHVVTPAGKHLNFILYKSEPGIAGRIRNANDVSNHLAKGGLPARRTYKDSRVLQVAKNRYGALYEYLAGSTIPWEAYTQTHLKLLGKTMSDMHASLAAMPRLPSPSVTDEYTAICRRMQQYFAEPGVQNALHKKLRLRLAPGAITRCIKLLNACRTLPHQQQLHMDFVRGNLLFESTAKVNLTGILDFEKTSYGHPLFDIARTLAFLLVDCKYKQPAKTYKYFIVSGYNKRGSGPCKINAANGRLLRELTNFFLLHDFYKFLRHNPYEYLHANEHFVRTLDQLLLNDTGTTIMSIKQ